MDKIITDNQLVRAVKHEDNDALLELVKRHEALYFRTILPSRIIAENNGIDIFCDKFHFFYEAAKKYDPKRKMKFSVYMAQRVKYLCKTLRSTPLKECELEDNLPEELQFKIPSDEILSLKSKINDIQDKAGRKILLDRYFNKSGKIIPFYKIAKKIKMSTRNVKYIHDRYIQLIKNQNQHVK